MKATVLISIIFLTSELCFCQNSVPALHLEANKIIYSDTIVTTPVIAERVLFDNALKWYKHHFESADNTLTIDKPNTGILSGTGIIHSRNFEKHAEPYDIYFTIEIRAATGAYSYRIYDLYSFEGTSRYYYSDMYNEELYPPAKPKWPKEYREMMLGRMNHMVSIVIHGLQDEMINGYHK